MPVYILKRCMYLICTCFYSLSFGQQPAAFVPCQEMPDLIQRYDADYRALARYYTPGSGGNARGVVAEQGIGSPEKRQRLRRLYDDYLKTLSQVSFNNLSQECKVDYILFKRDLTENKRISLQDDEQYVKISQWLPFAEKIYAMVKLRRRGHQPDAEKVAKEWFDMNAELKVFTAKLEDEKNLGAESIYIAGGAIADLKTALASIFEFYNGYDPMFTWWVPKPYEALQQSLARYGDVFKAKAAQVRAADKSGIVGQPAGRDELVRRLKYEMIPYTPEELIDIANREFAWCDSEMLKASKALGFGDNWKAALEKVKNSFVPAGKQPEAILKLYNESIDFLKKNDLITIPPLAEETWGMNMMSPERQLVNPFFLGGADIIISYPTNTMNEDDRLMSMRGNNPHFSRATVHHELIAGHNLQYFMNSRYRTYRNYNTPFWTEGWSLYWELLLWDMGFAKSPEDKIGMLFWHMHRCARIIFSLNYHMGKWTPQQCIDFLVDRVGHERANAEGEVRRSFVGRYPPLYQLAYLTGGRQFYALRQELVEKGKMTNKQFHDAVMQLNSMPVEMVRAILSGQTLSPSFETGWRFYDK